MRGSRSWRTALRRGVLGTALAVALAPVLSLTGAAAAELPGAITDVTIEPTSAAVGATLTTTIGWCVPDGSQLGDTFTLTMDPKLVGLPPGFTVRDGGSGTDSGSGGPAVANAVIGTGSPAVITFTLTDYASQHVNTCGTAFVTSRFVAEPNADYQVTATANDGRSFSSTLSVGPAGQLNRQNAQNFGLFPRPDQGRTMKSGALLWGVETPVGPFDAATIRNTVPDGQRIDCDSVVIRLGEPSGVNGAFGDFTDSSGSVDCSDSALEVDLGPARTGEIYQIRFRVTLPASTGADAAAQSFTNGADVVTSVDGVSRRFRPTAELTQAGAGGQGSGATTTAPTTAADSVSVGDVVWLDSDLDGRQSIAEMGLDGVVLTLTGPDGAAVTDVAGAPVGPTTTDVAGRYSFADLPVLAAGAHYTVTIDATASAAALAGLQPTVAEVGGDRGVDSSTNVAVSADLPTAGMQDRTMDFGFVRAEMAVMPTGGGDPASAPNTDIAVAAASESLPLTGFRVAVWVLSGVLALGVGAVLIIGVRRRRSTR